MVGAVTAADPGNGLLQPLRSLGIDQHIEFVENRRLTQGDGSGVGEVHTHNNPFGLSVGGWRLAVGVSGGHCVHRVDFLANSWNNFVAPKFDLFEHGFLVKVTQLRLQRDVLGTQDADFLQHPVDHLVD